MYTYIDCKNTPILRTSEGLCIAYIDAENDIQNILTSATPDPKMMEYLERTFAFA